MRIKKDCDCAGGKAKDAPEKKLPFFLIDKTERF
jgi:hypothetical protein